MKKINVLEPKQPVLAPRKRVAAYARVSMETERLKHSLSAHMPVFEKLLHDPDDKVRMEAPEIFRVLGKCRPEIDTTLHYAMVEQNNVKMSHKKYIG